MASARDLLEEGEKLRWSRQFDEAIDVLQQAAKLAAQEGVPSQLLADCLSWLGLVHSLRAKDRDSLLTARGLHEQALAIEIQMHGEQHARVAETLRLLGGTLAELGEMEEAYDVLSKSVSISKALFIPGRSALDALARLSDAAFATTRYDKAASAAIDYLEMPLEYPMSDLEEMAGHMRAGRAFLEAGKATEAVTHFERNVEIARIRGRVRGVAEMEEWLSRSRLAAGIKG